MKTSKRELLEKSPLKLPSDRKLPYAERKAQIDQARFIDIRVLVHNIYESSEGVPLMSYAETLDNRDLVKKKLLDYELAEGDILADGSENTIMSVSVIQDQPTPEAAPMAQTFQPVTMPTPPAATPSQAASAGSEPEEQAQPAPVAGRTRRRPGNGAGVAPPPGTMPPQSQETNAAPVPTTFQSVQPFAPAQAPQAFQSQPSVATPQTTQAPAPQAVLGAQVDLGPIVERVDAIGGMVSNIGNSIEKVDDKVNTLAANLTQEIAKIKDMQMSLLTVLHHLYATDPNLAPNLANAKVQTLPDFLNYLAPFHAGVPR